MILLCADILVTFALSIEQLLKGHSPLSRFTSFDIIGSSSLSGCVSFSFSLHLLFELLFLSSRYQNRAFQLYRIHF